MNGNSNLQWIYTENHITLAINALCNYVRAYVAFTCLTLVPWLITWSNWHYKHDSNTKISNKKILHPNY